MEYFIIIIFIIIAIIVIKWINSYNIENKFNQEADNSNNENQPFLKGPGLYNFDIVGESHYQNALSIICNGKTIDGHRKTVIAYLVCEDNNPYDNKAIRVDIDGMTVGYLNRQFAMEYRERLNEAGYSRITMACNALIVGGWLRGKDEGHFGVKIDLPRKIDYTCQNCGEWITTKRKKCPHCGFKVIPPDNSNI